MPENERTDKIVSTCARCRGSGRHEPVFGPGKWCPACVGTGFVIDVPSARADLADAIAEGDPRIVGECRLVLLAASLAVRTATIEERAARAAREIEDRFDRVMAAARDLFASAAADRSGRIGSFEPEPRSRQPDARVVEALRVALAALPNADLVCVYNRTVGDAHDRCLVHGSSGGIRCLREHYADALETQS